MTNTMVYILMASALLLVFGFKEKEYPTRKIR